MAYTDRELFARLIKCEAEAEGDNGMRAVATVVMNRVNVSNGEYLRVGQGSIRRIILQPNQFTCAIQTIGGKPNPRSIYTCPPEGIHYRIADWAMGGGLLSAVGPCLWFYNPARRGCNTYFPNPSGKFFCRVNSHCFFSPTYAYRLT